MPGFIWQATKEGYLKQLDIVKAEYEKAGPEGAYNAGLEAGKIVTEIASMAAGGLGAVKGSTSGAAKLSKVISKDPHPTVDIRHVYRVEKDGSKTQMTWGEGNYKQGILLRTLLLRRCLKVLGCQRISGYMIFMMKKQVWLPV
ncbi:hypothetical protein [Photorhabdus khanii]|uniref:Uncharacterized protein n=1 Tax=Photorhabdus khanii subsp. guanajuatensis TaxID=2100166 RepID=A0A4R4K2N5_9GAMM|nr:hypothetical protein [Photorhabdus khanii]TDB61614.1 hypothetical protein C5467_03725 [Photorhabdus khanii subsp. guanajuatensis]